MPFANAFLVWFLGHLAFAVLGIFFFGELIILVEMTAFFISLPALLLYALTAWIIDRLRSSALVKRLLFAAVCIAVTTAAVFYTTSNEGEDFSDLNWTAKLRFCAIAATALSLLLRPDTWRSNRDKSILLQNNTASS